MALSTADTDDARRYAGYPVTAAVQFADTTTQAASAQLDTTLAALTDDQISIMQNTYLVPLRILEAAIPASGDNLDTDQAAVWFHNRTEVADRTALFALTRYNFCLYLGVPPGNGVLLGISGGASSGSGSGSGSGIGLALPPAVFTV